MEVTKLNRIKVDPSMKFITNPILFPSENTAGIIYIKPGNLTCVEEVKLITKFLNNYNLQEMKGSLITLYKNGIIKIRGSKMSDG
jgi:hypothetical protein